MSRNYSEGTIKIKNINDELDIFYPNVLSDKIKYDKNNTVESITDMIYDLYYGISVNYGSVKSSYSEVTNENSADYPVETLIIELEENNG